MDSEIVPGFKEISTGNHRVRMVMNKAVPNLLKVDGRNIQCEYEGVVRLCRRCNLPGHHASECTTPQCERCNEWGHPCWETACKRCGDKVKTYSSVAQWSSSSQGERERTPTSADATASRSTVLMCFSGVPPQHPEKTDFTAFKKSSGTSGYHNFGPGTDFHATTTLKKICTP